MGCNQDMAPSPVLQHSRLIQHLLFVPNSQSVDALHIPWGLHSFFRHTPFPPSPSHFRMGDTIPDCPGEYLVNISLDFLDVYIFYQAWGLERCLYPRVPLPPAILFVWRLVLLCYVGGVLFVCFGSLRGWQPFCVLIRFSFCLSTYHFTWNPLSWCGEHDFFFSKEKLFLLLPFITLLLRQWSSERLC